VGVLVAILLDPRRSSLPRAWAGWRLATVQSGMYPALEAGERPVQGHGLEGLLTASVLAGFGAQLVVARLVTRLVRAARRCLAPLVEAPPPAARCVRGALPSGTIVTVSEAIDEHSH